MQPERGLLLGAPPGSPLTVHASWLPSGALLVAHLALAAYGDRGLWASVLLGIVTVCAYLLCVLLHATAHLVCARVIGARLGRVRVFVFGDTSEPRVSTGRPRAEAVLALSGPALSAFLGGGSLVWSAITAGSAADVLRVLGISNLALAGVNLLPVLPLDAGRLVASSGRMRARLATFGGKLVGLAALALGGWLLVQGPRFVDETALGAWLVLVGIFLFLDSSWSTAKAPVLPDVSGHTIGQWARPFAGRLDIRTFAPAGGGPYAVADGGRLAGVLIESHVREGTPVSDLMIPWTNELGMPSDAPLKGALERLSRNDVDCVVVLDQQGIVRGVLDEGAVRAQLAGGR
jgi:CBS domain-containing protein